MANINPRDFNALPPAAALMGYGFPSQESPIEEYSPIEEWENERIVEYKATIAQREKIGDIAESATLQGVVLGLALLASPFGILYAFSFQVFAGAIVAATRKKENRLLATGAFLGGLMLAALVQFYPHWETDRAIDNVAFQLGEPEQLSGPTLVALSAGGTLMGLALLKIKR